MVCTRIQGLNAIKDYVRDARAAGPLPHRRGNELIEQFLTASDLTLTYALIKMACYFYRIPLNMTTMPAYKRVAAAVYPSQVDVDLCLRTHFPRHAAREAAKQAAQIARMKTRPRSMIRPMMMRPQRVSPSFSFRVQSTRFDVANRWASQKFGQPDTGGVGVWKRENPYNSKSLVLFKKRSDATEFFRLYGPRDSSYPEIVLIEDTKMAEVRRWARREFGAPRGRKTKGSWYMAHSVIRFARVDQAVQTRLRWC